MPRPSAMPNGRWRKRASASSSTRRSRTGLLAGASSSSTRTRISPASGSTPDRKILEIARPAGVVFALTPSTNPVATVFYKIMLCLLTRNAIIISPHPMAKACCADAARLLAKAAEEAGAPDGVIQVIEEPSLPIIETVMKSDRIDVILATGGTPVVRAAYSSGNPAIGVGPGNVPAYVDETRRCGAGGEGDRRLQSLRQRHIVHQ